jgi:hypothetical protein
MPETGEIFLSGAVEGLVDEAVLRRLVRFAGGSVGPVHPKQGKRLLLDRLAGYNEAARYSPWFVLVDLDHDAECAPPFRHRCLPTPVDGMCFRIAVREVEAWLLADSERLAAFLSVRHSRIPPNPDSLGDPKQRVIQIARDSRRRDIREDMVPRPGSGRSVGPAYSARLIEFVQSGWRPRVAARNSESLRRCTRRLRNLVASTAARA